MELFKIKKDIPFMSYGRITTFISAATFILAVIFIATKGLNFGVDFRFVDAFADGKAGVV